MRSHFLSTPVFYLVRLTTTLGLSVRVDMCVQRQPVTLCPFVVLICFLTSENVFLFASRIKSRWLHQLTFLVANSQRTSEPRQYKATGKVPTYLTQRKEELKKEQQLQVCDS